MPYILEQARSGRSTCKGKCKQPIPQDDWRLGSVTEGDYPLTYFKYIWMRGTHDMGRCFPCVTKKQCSNILGVYDSFAAMVRAQGVEDADSAKLQEAFFTAVHDGEEGAAQALAHALNSGEAYEEEEGSEEEVVAPPPKRKSKKATAAAAKPKKDTKKKAAAAKPKAEAKPKPKAKPKAPRLSHGEWESAVLRALAAAAAEGVEAAVVHDAVAADVGAAAYKKGQVTGALGRLETQGLVQQATPAEAAAAEEAEPEEGGAKKRKRKRKALPLWSLTEAGRARADGESEEDEAEAEAEEQEAVVAAVLKPEAKAKARKPAKAKAAAKKKTKAVASSSKGKKKAKAVKAEAAEEEMEEDGDDESEAAAAKSKPQPKPKKKTRADAVVDPARLQCAMSQRFFCLAGAIDVGDATHAHPSGVFEVLSAKSQSVYKVTFRVAAQPKRRGKGRGRGRQGDEEQEAEEELPPVCIGSCNCPDSRMRGLSYSCKHQLFVAIRILGLEAELEGEGLPVGAFRDALNAPRLAHLRLTAEDYEDMEVDDEEEETAAAGKGKAKAKATATGVPRKPLGEDSECGVCFEALVEGARAEGMSYCNVCGNSLHTACFAKWKNQSATRYGQAPSCVYCRATNSVVPV